MWPEAELLPPRTADELLDGVLRRGLELRRTARLRRQITWLGRATAVVAAAGLAAGLTYGTTGDGPGPRRGVEVAAPADDGTSTTADAPSTTGAPDPRPVVPAPPDGTSTTSAPGSARRIAPLAVLEQRSADGTYRTVVLHPDGAVVPVTAATADRQMPVLSPLGDTIAFQQRAPHPVTGQLRWEVFTVGVGGSNLRQVTGGLIDGGPRLLDNPLGSGSRWPSWSPDGLRLTFSCAGPTGQSTICVSRADGLFRRVIAAEGQGFYQPAWSPDGQSIAAKREVDGGQVELWLLNAAGGGAIPLPIPTVDPRGVRLSWTIDGNELVYAQVEGGPNGLVILDIASGQRRLVTTPTPARFPVVCGNDQVLYLQSDVPLDEDGLRVGPLVLVGADGSAPTTVLPAEPGVEHLPSSCATR